MIVYPALDLRGGRVVQLVGGVPGTDRVSLPDPVAVAARWIRAGLRALHVVDLDAALDGGTNRDVIVDVLRASTVPVQVGGGIRDASTIERWLAAGASRVIVGTRAIEDPAWLDDVASSWPDRIIVAADTRDRRVVVRGWKHDADMNIEPLLERLDRIELGGVLITDVRREGRMLGVDVTRFRGLAALTRHPLIAAGGIAGMSDLRALADAGLAGAVLGMSLYTGAVDAVAAALEFVG